MNVEIPELGKGKGSFVQVWTRVVESVPYTVGQQLEIMIAQPGKSGDGGL